AAFRIGTVMFAQVCFARTTTAIFAILSRRNCSSTRESPPSMLKLTEERTSEQRLQAMEAFPDSSAHMALVGERPDPANSARSARYARGGLSPRALRRVKEHIKANIDKRISVD